MGKSIVAARNLKKGMKVSMKDLAFKSPGGGLPPYELENLVGKKLKRDINEDEPIKYDITE
jgi:sialic acid synthase SpsE